MSESAQPGADRAVFSRAVSILAAFADPPSTTLTLTVLAERTGLPLSTVHRLCGQLAAERMLERLPSGGFRVGLRLWELGTLAPRSGGLRELALPYLEDLYEVTRQHVQLMVLDGIDAVVVERLSSKSAPKLESRAGGRLPLYAASGGVAMLAYASEGVLQQVLDQGLRAHSPSTIENERDLRAAIATVREQGWVELRDQLTPGTISIAAPVLVRPKSALGAVSAVVSADTDIRGIVPAVVTTSRAIARAVLAAPAPR